MATVKSVSGDYTLIANGGAGTITFVGNVVTTTTPTTISPFLTVAANNTGNITDMGLLAQTGANTFAGLRFTTGSNVWQVSDSVASDGSPIAPYATLSTSLSTYGNANVANFMPTFTGDIGTANTSPLNAIYANSYFYGNGDPFIGGGGGGTYSNANVQDYLPTYSGFIGANIGLQVTGVLLADTPTNATSNTQVATTQYVTNSVRGGDSGVLSTNQISANGNIQTSQWLIAGNSIFSNGNINLNGSLLFGGANSDIDLGPGLLQAGNIIVSSNLQVNGEIISLSSGQAISTPGNISANELFISGITNVGGNTANIGSAVDPFGNVFALNFAASNVEFDDISLNGNLTFNGADPSLIMFNGNMQVANVIVYSDLQVNGEIISLNTGDAFSTPGNITSNGILTSNIYNTGGNTANIGSDTEPFGTVFALATSALYADLAEMYSSDSHYAPATVLEFGGEAEVTTTTHAVSSKVAGVVSTQPAYVMNQCQKGKFTVALALAGRVPCQVIGTVKKGDLIVSSDVPGVGKTLDDEEFKPGCVIGKALENYNSTDVGIIQVVVGVR